MKEKSTFAPWERSCCDGCGEDFQVARTKSITIVGDVLCEGCEMYRVGYNDGQARPNAVPAFVKNDGEKARLDLVPPVALDAVGRVLAYGARKYAPGNWKLCTERGRYVGAALRHVTAYMRGEVMDQESGEHHLAHAVCSLMFLIEMDAAKDE